MTTPPIPHFPDFLQGRPELCEQATALWLRLPTEKEPSEAQRLLEQLIGNSKMKSVWTEIYKKKAGSPEHYLNPACLTNHSQAAARREKAQELRKKGGEKNIEDAKFLDFEAMLMERLPKVGAPPELSEQDYAAQQFLIRAYRIGLDPTPVIFRDLQSDLDKLRNISRRLRDLARDLETMGQYVFPSYSEKIEEVADDLENDAQVMTPNLVNTPWVIVRERGDLRLRTIVGKLADCTYSLFLKIMPSTIASVTNVIQDCKPPDDQGTKVTRDTVLQMLGKDNNLKIRPTFGPAIYPMRDDPKFQRALLRSKLIRMPESTTDTLSSES